jgi:diguanylate cyclase (GGDEF)-like protein
MARTLSGNQDPTSRGGLITGRLTARTFVRGAPEALLVLGCLLLVGPVGLLDYWAGPDFSAALFYLIPVTLAAWWTGRRNGFLVSLAAAITWFLVDNLHTPAARPGPRLWNEIAHLGFFAVTASLVCSLRVRIVREESLTRTDSLTGAANGRAFYEATHLELERARRTRRPVTVVFLDLDDFQQLNSRLGRGAGDRVLGLVANTLRARLRGSDVVGRLGADEFGLLMPETDGTGAAMVLARVRSVLHGETAQSGRPVSVSIGAATFLRPPDVDEVVRYVDAQLTAAKNRGKGRLEHQVVAGAENPGPGNTEERRVAPRLPCNRLARIQCLTAAGSKAWFALIRELSPEGVGLYTELRLAKGSLLTIEALYAPGAKTLLARVVRSTGRQGGWSHGCVLSAPLSAADLELWLTAQEDHPEGGARISTAEPVTEEAAETGPSQETLSGLPLAQ